jgi:hypothetical protein
LERLEALANGINDYPSDDEAESRATSSQLLPAFERPLQVEPSKPSVLTAPTDHTASAKSTMPAFDQKTGPVIRLTRGTWEALGDRSRGLEEEVAMLSTAADNDTSMHIGKLRYQNESNNDQKASMGRVIAERDLEFKQQLDMQEQDEKMRDLEAKLKESKQKEGEPDRLRRAIDAADAAHAKDLKQREPGQIEEDRGRLTASSCHFYDSTITQGNMSIQRCPSGMASSVRIFNPLPRLQKAFHNAAAVALWVQAPENHSARRFSHFAGYCFRLRWLGTQRLPGGTFPRETVARLPTYKLSDSLHSLHIHRSEYS